MSCATVETATHLVDEQCIMGTSAGVACKISPQGSNLMMLYGFGSLQPCVLQNTT